ncbi:MAG: Flp pilus assembly complex ATPase component TadA [Erysipelotrichaceae bacterium]|nr:Flp pilus assembly complex ATPase component TadA [Erysipelotrichaceae bacterium]
MEERFETILRSALEQRTTDIHFTIKERQCSISIRTLYGMRRIQEQEDDWKLFNYLEYRAHLNISASTKPQSGSFSHFLDGQLYDFRFAVISTMHLRNGVLRILNFHDGFTIPELTSDIDVQNTFCRWLQLRSGLILFCGPTGSGKTTTMYSLLRTVRNKNIYSLEDPIEIQQNNMIQLEVNEKSGMTYDEGIRQILRHDPDIVMIGEIRDRETARMTVRAALTGCLVLSSLHSRNAATAITRMLELGVQKHDLSDCLVGISAQRLIRLPVEEKYECEYEILHEDHIQLYFSKGTRQHQIVNARNERLEMTGI